MSPPVFLTLNLAVAFYNVGTIWANHLDIFPTWRLVGRKEFPRIHQAHWKKLPYWVLLPWGLEIAGATALIWYHPANSPVWAIYGGASCVWLSLILTILMWGPWQGKLSRDPLGPDSPLLLRILKTHWIRVALVNGYALIVLVWLATVIA
jgi:hypothetical protein